MTKLFQHSGKCTLRYSGATEEEVSAFCTCDIVNAILQYLRKTLEEAEEENIEISFLELANIITTLSSGMITNRKYCDKDKFKEYHKQ